MVAIDKPTPIPLAPLVKQARAAGKSVLVVPPGVFVLDPDIDFGPLRLIASDSIEGRTVEALVEEVDELPA